MKALVALILALAAAPTWACSVPAGAVQVGALAVMTVPEKIPLGKPFAVQIAACDNAPERLSVDAHMPAHRHGMNYRPTISRTENGFRAEGLLFHMPGEWEFIFELRFNDGRSEKLTHRVTVR